MVDDENGSDLHVLVAGVKSLLRSEPCFSLGWTREKIKASDVSSHKSTERRVGNGRLNG
jgi:hypothetical protein